VIGLTPNLFYGTGIPACVLLINKAKSAERKGKVLFVNGAEEMVEGKNQNSLSEENVRRLSEGFHTYEDEDRFSRVVSLEEIEKNDFNLNIARYVQNGEEEEAIDVANELKKLEELQARRDSAEATMMRFVGELGYGT
jgi:type I restriction enzyme M protein